jgi:hypothetical protein
VADKRKPFIKRWIAGLPQQNSTEGIADGEAERFLESIRPLQQAAAAGAAAAEAAKVREETLRRNALPPKGGDQPQEKPAVLESNHAEGSWTTDDWAVAAVSALISVPLCEAGWHAVVNEPEHFARGLTAIVIGVPLGLAGFSFHRWKTKISAEARDRISSAAQKWWPVAAFLAFGYFAAPVAYQRATYVPPAPIVNGFTQQQVDEKVSAATKPLEATIAALQQRSPKVDKPSYPPRLPGDADKEIQVIDNFSEILRKEAQPQPQKGRDILGDWQDALDDVKQPAYFQSIDRYRNEVLATNGKIWDMIQQYPQYCDNDLCAMIDPRQNVNVTDAFDELKRMLIGLRGIIDPDTKRGAPALVKLVTPSLNLVGEQISVYGTWITDAGNKLSDRRKELGKGGR